jgi:hypothetical protein
MQRKSLSPLRGIHLKTNILMVMWRFGRDRDIMPHPCGLRIAHDDELPAKRSPPFNKLLAHFVPLLGRSS